MKSLASLFQPSLSEGSALKGTTAVWKQLGVVAASEANSTVLYGLALFQLSGPFGVLVVSMDFQSLQWKVIAGARVGDAPAP